MTTIILDAQGLGLARGSRATGVPSAADAQPRLLSGLRLRGPVALMTATCWRELPGMQKRGVRCAAAIRGGRIAKVDVAFATTYKHSNRSGPPLVSPPA